MKVKHLIPLAIFLVIAIFLGIGLTRDPRKLPSTFIDKPAPAFRVHRFGEGHRRPRIATPLDGHRHLKKARQSPHPLAALERSSAAFSSE